MTRTLKAGWHLIPAAALAWGLLLGSCQVFGQDIKLDLRGDGIKVIEVPQQITVMVKQTVVAAFPFVIEAGGLDPMDSALSLFFWKHPDAVQSEDQGSILKVLSAPKGSLIVSVKAHIPKTDKDGRLIGFATKFTSITVNVGDVPVTVPDPIKPPPIPLPGLRVLIIHETEAGPPGVNLIISGEKVRNYMAEKGAKGGFLALDKDLTAEQLIAAGQEQWVVEAFKRPRTSLPWVIISNGVTGFEGPLPTTNAPTDALNLIKKLGG